MPETGSWPAVSLPVAVWGFCSPQIALLAALTTLLTVSMVVWWCRFEVEFVVVGVTKKRWMKAMDGEEVARQPAAVVKHRRALNDV
jgi:hypothetical protein